MKLVFVFLSLFIGAAASAQVFKNISGQLINHTSIPLNQLQVKISWGTYASLSFGDGCKGLSWDSAQVSVDTSGNFKFPKIGSSAHSICRRIWKTSIVTPVSDVESIDSPYLKANDNDEFLFENISHTMSTIHIGKATDLFIEIKDSSGQLASDQLIKTYNTYFDSHCDLNVGIHYCFPFFDWYGEYITSNPILIPGRNIVWNVTTPTTATTSVSLFLPTGNFKKEIKIPLFNPNEFKFTVDVPTVLN